MLPPETRNRLHSWETALHYLNPAPLTQSKPRQCNKHSNDHYPLCLAFQPPLPWTTSLQAPTAYKVHLGVHFQSILHAMGKLLTLNSSVTPGQRSKTGMNTYADLMLSKPWIKPRLIVSGIRCAIGCGIKAYLPFRPQPPPPRQGLELVPLSGCG